MVIKKINLNKVEDFLKEIIEDTTEIETFNEENEDVNQTLSNNERDFKAGKISNEIYNDIKNDLEKEKKLIESKITLKKDEILINLKELSKIIVSNKI